MAAMRFQPGTRSSVLMMSSSKPMVAICD
jgi:hypothetical protein